MTVLILKIDKDSLDIVSEMDLEMSNSVGMTISHYADVTKSTSATLPFVIEGVKAQIPEINSVDYCVVIRKKVDFSSIGSNLNESQSAGKDIGQTNYKDKIPVRPKDLPKGFEELYRG